ncbi:RIP metalloprotease RseP [Jannaschia aquimarina]|uniref:Zinc metalloprotease n=1 Tax=Jannaschia aquimarina TaxID=935700 RepID=A0A0D1D7P2_9RHOB|nr:RIP metalloprotease RseP [Jannaschia aquimarina]KIT15998.1 Regulator of sigma-E protease RseP [Jannaschia aquimarina]SNS99690.1 regulator of sigma E protease [Jannaschia aquimarina]
MDAAGVIFQFGSVMWTLLAFIVAISIIVAVHEYGHYIVGRWCGIKADVFSIGFGPVLLKRMDSRGTQWQLAALPLGGYVKFRGDANAASVGDDGTVATMSASERAETMTGAALWKRAATVFAGPAINFLLTLVIFAAFALFTGRATDDAVVGDYVALPADVPTLVQGDEVLAVEGTPVGSLTDMHEQLKDVSDQATVTYTVLRDGAELEVEAAPALPPRAGSVEPRSAAWQAGIRPGDLIQTVDGSPIHSFRDLQNVVAASEGATLELEVWRPEEGMLPPVALNPRESARPAEDGGFENKYLIGIGGELAFAPATEWVGPFSAIAHGATQTYDIAATSLSALKHILIGTISTCNLSGPVGIAQVSGATASLGAENFILFIAILSTAVGLLNLFPIPVLDGGHLVFYAYEAVRGRPPSDNAVKVLMTAGITLMAALMIFALSNDLFCPGGLLAR